MPFANVDASVFPAIRISFIGSLADDNDFQMLLGQWSVLYSLKKPFTLIFDTTQMGSVPVSYCAKMALFIRKMREESKKYLKRTIVLLDSTLVANLLKTVLSIQGPVCPVSIIDCNKHENVQYVIDDILQEKHHKDVHTMNPESDKVEQEQFF
jgi:hypothetical protein